MRRSAALLFAVLISLFLHAGQAHAAPDAVQFAKTTVTKMTEGDISVIPSIDFDHLVTFGTDVGAIYKKMPTAADKVAFRKSFIQSFSRSFKNTGARASYLTNWKVKSKKGNSTVVSTTGKTGKTMLVTLVSAGSGFKLTGLAAS